MSTSISSRPTSRSSSGFVPSASSPSSSPISSSSSFGSLTIQPTSTVAASDVTPSASSTVSSGGSTFGSGSASLYLYTFLATLVLLLAVSAGIISRSFFMRRARQRMIAAAIANGTWVPPSPNSRGGIDASKKPVMFEVYVGGENEKVALHEDGWEGVTPFSAQYTSFPLPSPSPSPLVPPASARRSVAFWRRRQRPTVDLPLSATPPPSSLPLLSPATPATAQVAMLVAMPSPMTSSRSTFSASHHSDSSSSSHHEEERLPYIEFGIAEVPVVSHDHEHGHGGEEEAAKMGSEENV